MLNTLFFKVDTENEKVYKKKEKFFEKQKVVYKTLKKIPYYSSRKNNILFSDFRNDLNNSLNQFQTESKNDILYAKFTTKDRSTYDLDNILLYNVLKTSANNTFKNGIICELKYSETFDNIYNHEYSYELINKEHAQELFEDNLKLFDFEISVFNKVKGEKRKTILKKILFF